MMTNPVQSPRNHGALVVPVPEVEVQFCLNDPAFLANPYPAYEAAQALGTVLKGPSRRSHTSDQAWYVVGYEACREVLTSENFVKGQAANSGESEESLSRALQRWPLLMDPPEHKQQRRALAVGYPFHPPTHLAHVFLETVEPSLRRMIATGAGELVRDVITPAVDRYIASFAGISESQQEEVFGLVEQIANGLLGNSGPKEWSGAQRAYDELLRWFTSWRSGRTDPSGPFAGNPIANDPSLFTMVVFAGRDAMRSAMASVAMRWIENPQWHDWITISDGNALRFVLEACRLDAPIQVTWRRAANTTELANRRIGVGEHVAVILGAANRDPNIFPQSHAFLPGRLGPIALSFGTGIHHCLGMKVALDLSTTLLGALNRHSHDLANFTVNHVHWLGKPPFRAISELHVSSVRA